MTSTALTLVGLALAAFLFRLLFSMFSGSDSRGVHWRLERLKERRWIRYDLPDCATPAVHGYPVLFHWIISRAPRRAWIAFGYLVNAALDLAVAAAVFTLTGWAAGDVRALDNASVPHFAVAATALFLFTPALVPNNARMMSFNGRAFGLLVYHAWLLAAMAHLVYGSWIALALAGASIVVVVLSSQFGFQAVVATTVGLAIGYRSWTIVAIGPVALALAALVPAVGVREPLRYFSGLYAWQFRQRHTGTMPASRARWIPSAFRYLRQRRFNAFCHIVLSNSPQVLSVLYAPACLVLAWYAIAHFGTLRTVVDAPLARFQLVVVITLTATTLLTSFSPFSIFGQAERYLEYAAPGVAILVTLIAAAIANTPGDALAFLAGFAVLQAAICVFNALHCARRAGLLFGASNPLLTLERAVYHDWFDRLPDGAKVLPVPLRRGKTISAGCRAHGGNAVRVLYDWISIDGEPPLEYMSRYLGGQRYTPEGFRAALDDYDFDAALVFIRDTSVWMGDHGDADWHRLTEALDDGWTVVAEDDDYALVARADRWRGGAA